jgi:F-type H+-transporting ATPase subunit epsilon
MAILLDIVTPEHRVVSLAVDEVRAPGALGGFGIRQGHTPFLAALEPGQLTYVEAGVEHPCATGGGFLQVADDKVVVLADAAEHAAEIDVERAERAFREATERLRHMTEQDQGYRVESARVRRATARLRVAGH